MKPIRLTHLLAGLDSAALTPEASIAIAREAIAAGDGTIGAFVRLAPASSHAEALAATGPLRGVPLGVKDIYDTADMATEYGSPIYAGHRPRADAALVTMARRRGAYIAGKTATTEFAHMQPAATRNPRDLAHTPGGSSSGSAAAVAAGMVAGAFGSQTAGSIIRPAAFCGVAGYKPSFRLLPTVGMKTFAWSLDTAGLFAAGVADVALLAALLTGRDLAVPATPLGSLRIGLYRSTADAGLAPDMRSAVATAAGRLEAAGAALVDMPEPDALAEARDAQRMLQDFEAALALGHEHEAHADALSPGLRAALDAGAAITPDAYDAARRVARHGRKAATALFDGVDALLVPSALGAAPRSLETTGDPAMNRLWTLTGNPCVNVPGLVTTAGMPLGLTIVTRFGRDRDALAIGAHLEELLA
ncbi:amidase [Aureimonas sp. SA4125]|uniref:amidase n=1 Tax=Aureimonas sp. SA4125 TaxID=2826993 RepID=UPI001CC674D6|nr:amidase [Aureimonas sp. SA4125]BDA85612.1 amidase [Aureimonas sp. SA4125]